MSEQHTPDKGSRKLSLKRSDASAETPRLQERLHKVLAQAGLGSRRALEQRIADGLVKVNGEVAQVGMSIGSGDKVDIDGRSFVASALSEPSRVLMYNKPEGEVTTREDPEGRPTIFEALPALKGARWIAIGRLDINTTGLLLLTTDGELANAMMHPSFEVEREYVCRVRAPEGMDKVPDNLVDRLRRGVALEDGPAKFDDIERIGGTDSHDWFRVLLKEGRNREVRRLWESQGCQVSRLKRIRYGNVELPQPLLRGHSQELPADTVEALRKELGLEDGAPSALTLQPVIGQRKAAKSTVHIGRDGHKAGNAYLSGHVSAADEGRELRRFDNMREDRGRGRGGPRKQGLTVTGEAAAKQSQRAFKPKGPRTPGQRGPRGDQQPGAANPAAFRTWYVPEGVDTGPSGHRNPDGARGPRKPYGPKPGGAPGARGPGGPRPGAGGGYQGRNERGPGGPGFGDRGPRGPGGPGGPRRDSGFVNSDPRGPRGPRTAGSGQGQRTPRPYGHPGNAPSFPSDHANPGSFNPYGDKPRSPRPAGAGPRPGGRPAGGPRPGGAPRPAGPRPGGPRGGGRPGGGRGPQGGNR
jgi:23S rRNA pseudouridine2605 synthase